MKGNNAEDLNLISSYWKGDEGALLKLLEKYKPLIKKEASSLSEMYFEDAMQEMIEEFIRSVKLFTEEKKVYFCIFLRRRLHWKILILKRRWIPIYECEVLEETVGTEEISFPESRSNVDEMVDEIADYFKFSKEEKILLLSILTNEPAEAVAKKLGYNRRTYFRHKNLLLERLKESINEILKNIF